MRVAYLGTSEFAVDVLERLARSEHEVALVVTRPDRPKGRGRKVSAPPVATAAKALELPLAQPDDVHALDFPEVDALVVCAFGALIKEPLLSGFEIFNVHPSLLPRWRGAAPVERAIMAGDPQTGVAIMQLEAGLDSGPVYAMEPEPIRPGDDYGTLARRLAERGAELLIRVLTERPEPSPQPDEGVTYAEKITPADRTLPADPAAAERTVRALRPHIGARIERGEGEFLGVWDARVGDGGDLELIEVQPAGGRRMPFEAYRRGRA